jgi:hypothetical protein
MFLVLSCENYTNSPSLKIYDSPKDLGQLKLGKSYPVKFKIVNNGTAQLHIDTVSVSCDCTEPSFLKKMIAPGDSADLTVTFTPYDKGPFSKVMVVKSNADSIFSVISFSGTIVE